MDYNLKLKKCSRCKEYLPLNKFSIDKKTKSGHQSYCKKCRKEMYHENRHINKIKEKEYRMKNPINIWAMHTRNNHQRRGIKINISVKKLTELGEMAVKNGCYYCGTKFDIRNSQGKAGEFTSNAMTVDLIDSNRKVMDEQNIRILCHSCNSGKGTLNEEEFLLKCKKIVERWSNDLK